MSDDPERRRLTRIYAGYQADARKRRAWSAENPGNRAIRDELVAALGPWLPRSGDVLDAGCGRGWMLARLLAAGVPGARLHGLDALPARVEAAQAAAPGATVHAGDVRSLPYPDGAFSLVVFLTVLS